MPNLRVFLPRTIFVFFLISCAHTEPTRDFQPVDAGVHLKKVQLGDAQMATVDVGEGPTVVLIHGNPTTHLLWRHIIPKLSPLVRVVAPDLMGMGASDALETSFTLEDQYKYFETFIEQLDADKVHLVGHEWGCALAFLFAMRRPKKVKSLTIVEGLCRATDPNQIDPRLLRLVQYYKHDSMAKDRVLDSNHVVREWLTLASEKELDPKLRKTYEYYTADSSRRLATWSWFKNWPFRNESSRNSILMEQAYEAVRLSTIPKLLLWSDPGFLITDVQRREMERDFRFLQSIPVGEGRHLTPENNPTPIAQAITRWVLKLENQ